ncbi:MAG: 2-oxoglutarate dehydrogenase E1 subunit family protein, partial [Ilumatobacteraceae bacterium]
MSETLNPPTDAQPDFGANSWLVEEMYEQFRLDPASVGESWREFFSDYKSLTSGAAPAAPASKAVAQPSTNGSAAPVAPVAATAAPATSNDAGEPIKGSGVAIVANMERSLTVPTATSFRNIPAKLLE